MSTMSASAKQRRRRYLVALSAPIITTAFSLITFLLAKVLAYIVSLARLFFPHYLVHYTLHHTQLFASAWKCVYKYIVKGKRVWRAKVVLKINVQEKNAKEMITPQDILWIKYSKELKEKNTLNVPKWRLWARMISFSIYDSMNDTPIIPACKENLSKRSSVSDSLK